MDAPCYAISWRRFSSERDILIGMTTHSASFMVNTTGRGFQDLTREVAALVKRNPVTKGIALVFLHHTSASLILCENADPTVRSDLEHYLSRLVPDGDPGFEHDAEGDDDMPAHIRSVLCGVSLSIPVLDGTLDLGTWQGIYLYEHRTAPHRRRISVTVVG